MRYLQFWQWNIGADTAVARFDAGTMSAYAKFLYFAIATIFGSIAMFMSSWVVANFDLNFSPLDSLDGYIGIVLGAFGLWYLFKKHTEVTSFVEKFFVVLISTLPVIFVLSFLFAVVYYTLITLAGFDSSEGFMGNVQSTDVVFNALLTVLTFWKMGTYFK